MKGSVGTPTQLRRVTNPEIQFLTRLKKLWNEYKTFGSKKKKRETLLKIRKTQSEFNKWKEKNKTPPKPTDYGVFQWKVDELNERKY